MGKKKSRFLRGGEREVCFLLGFFWLNPDRQNNFWCPCLPFDACESRKGQSEVTALPESRPAALHTKRISPSDGSSLLRAHAFARRPPPAPLFALRSSVISLSPSMHSLCPQPPLFFFYLLLRILLKKVNEVCGVPVSPPFSLLHKKNLAVVAAMQQCSRQQSAVPKVFRLLEGGLW